MDVVNSLNKRCPKCKFIKRKGINRMICDDPNHKARQRGRKKRR